MEFRNLGHTELKVSELCLGTMQLGWTVNEPDSYRILVSAYEAGINFIDTADIYSNWVSGNPGGVSEMIVGNWIEKDKIPRDQIVLATKVRGKMGEEPDDEGLSRTHIMKAIEGSLRRLQTDYIDLYQTHWFDENTPIAETLRALDDLVQQGKVRYIGCSNYPAWRLMEALLTSENLSLARYDCLQPNYSIAYRDDFERETEEVCKKFNLGVIPYSPLAGGFLTGKYSKNKQSPVSVRAEAVRNRYINDRNWEVLNKLETLGHNRGKSISQMALGWLISRPGITAPIIGPRTLEQLADNLGAIGIRLSEEENRELNKVSDWKNING